MSVKLVCSRSAALYESGLVPIEVPEMVTLGPFEYVELAYDLLRVSPEGDGIGYFSKGGWWLRDDGHPFSELSVWADDGEASADEEAVP